MAKDRETEIELLIEKAAKAEKSEDAMRFSQAAVNAANALCALKVVQKEYQSTTDMLSAKGLK